MAESKDNIEVAGFAIVSILQAMGAFAEKGYKILEENGIHNPQKDEWYPRRNWNDSLKTIDKTIGPATMRQIGISISSNTVCPPDMDLETCLEKTDIMYHLAHRKNGIVMYDPKTNLMLDGLDHYQYKKTSDRSIELVCNSPYPCMLDMGGITGLGRRFKPKDALLVTVEHKKNTECRQLGGKSCTYLIRW